MTISKGMRFGQYEIAEPLGKGGMGEVYLARDTRLERQVALKILPPEFTQSLDRLRRFEQEARAASALNHPNIITIHEIGALNGTHFITTEFIAGQTLRTRLQQPLAQAEAIDIALQIAHALVAAHEAGIIHRDVKPDNVMIRRDSIVKVLDFGLAKLTETRNAERGTRSEEEVETLLQDEPQIHLSAFSDHGSTTPGTVMGTASYMSPEQARGEKVDERSDLFSLGIVLYEMLAGRPPFEGANMLDVVGAILYRDFAPLPIEVPVELQRIVTKALQKDRSARYQTAQDFAHDLQEWKEELAYQARAAKASGETERLGAHAPRVPAASANPSTEVETLHTEPSALAASARGARAFPRLRATIIALAALLLVAAAYFYFTRKATPALTDKDTILLADFENKTEDAVFDGTLKQALAVHLGQSPFLNIFGDERVRETLRLMNRSPDERVTREIGREICQRQGLKAMLTGTIASLGYNYVINLEAINGQTGDVLAREQTEAEGKEHVLRTLGEAATRLREKLGESLSSIQKFDVPLREATTSSLEALKAYTMGSERNQQGRTIEGIPFVKRAIELDPNFAAAYSLLSVLYNNTRQSALAAEAQQKAFELRDRASEREKLAITAGYYQRVTGEIRKAIEVLELMKQSYPRDRIVRANLGDQYAAIGEDEKAHEESREALRLNPTAFAGYVITHMQLNHFAEAKSLSEQVIAQKIDGVATHRRLYYIAFVQGDAAAMQQHVAWANARPGEYEHMIWQGEAAAFAGQWQRAWEFISRAVELAEQRGFKEVAGEIAASNAEWLAALGKCQQSRAEIARALAFPRTPRSFLRNGMALALCGEVTQTNALIEETVKQFPKNTLVNEIYLPLFRAALELQRGNRTQAIQILQAASRYESVSFFYQNYLRGQAYLGERNGVASAAEFQTILEHRGWSPASPLYPLAHLGLARAAMLQGDTAKARKSYQDFFALWKDADADLPVLIEAKKEYAKLQ